MLIGVLAGADVDWQRAQPYLAGAEYVVAADGAVRGLLAAGLRCDAVVGDMDSIGDAPLPDNLQIYPDADQSRSDADKLFTLLATRNQDSAMIIGLEGDRLDHMLASLASAARSRLQLSFLLRRGMGYLVRAGQDFSLRCKPGDTLSLLPLLPCRGVTFANVEWPLDMARLDMLGLLSLSNRAIASDIHIALEAGLALLQHIEGNP